MRLCALKMEGSLEPVSFFMFLVKCEPASATMHRHCGASPMLMPRNPSVGSVEKKYSSVNHRESWRERESVRSRGMCIYFIYGIPAVRLLWILLCLRNSWAASISYSSLALGLNTSERETSDLRHPLSPPFHSFFCSFSGFFLSVFSGHAISAF